MLADLRSMLETDWNDERPELTFFCQGGDGRAYQVTPERVGMKKAATGGDAEGVLYTFVMEGTGSQKMNVPPGRRRIVARC